jgi:hypothetical protein
VQFLRTIPQLQSNRDNISADLCIHFVGGGLAGITAATSTYPLDLVRTRLAAQVSFKSSNAFEIRRVHRLILKIHPLNFNFGNLQDLDSDFHFVLF